MLGEISNGPTKGSGFIKLPLLKRRKDTAKEALKSTNDSIKLNRFNELKCQQLDELKKNEEEMLEEMEKQLQAEKERLEKELKNMREPKPFEGAENEWQAEI